MKITFLGTGTSHGVPAIDCTLNGFAKCRKGICKQALLNPDLCRTRSSIFVEYKEKSILIDVSPDFRSQALRARIQSIDAVLITHSHADHIGGIPDIRSYTPKTRDMLPFYGSAESMGAIQKSYSYIFDPATFVGGGIPRISVSSVSGAFELFGQTIRCIPVEHAELSGCYGYRIGSMAYLPDVKRLDDVSTRLLSGLDVLILNCLREDVPHASHLTLAESMDLARHIRPKRCIFTHMSHDIDYRSDTQKLDPWMAFARDGQSIEIP